MEGDPEIIGGPTPMVSSVRATPTAGEVQPGTAQKHVYVQIADALRAQELEEPLRSCIESKGESVLRRLLEHGNVPVRIKITSAGITEVGIDRRARPCRL